MPEDPLALIGDAIEDARAVGSVIFDGLLDSLAAGGLFALYPAVMALGRSDQELVVLVMLDEVLHGGERFGFPADYDPADRRGPEDEPPVPHGRAQLAEVGYGILHGGWDEVVRRLRVRSDVEVQTMILDTLGGSYGDLLKRLRREGGWW
jgi:hypothetical protein